MNLVNVFILAQGTEKMIRAKGHMLVNAPRIMPT